MLVPAVTFFLIKVIYQEKFEKKQLCNKNCEKSKNSVA